MGAGESALMLSALLVVVGIYMLKGATIEKHRVEIWLIRGDGSQLVDSQIKSRNEMRINISLFDRFLIHDLDHIA